MKAKKNSLNAKLYCWFYGKRIHQLPNNLCPYFWKLVLAWVLLIPYVIITLPVILFYELFDNHYENGDVKTGDRMGISFVIYSAGFFLMVVGISIGSFFITYLKGGFIDHMVPLGFFILGLIIIIGGYQGIKAWREYIINSRIKYDENGNIIWEESKEKTPNILIEFIKAKYGEYCPRIEWIDNEKEK